MLHIRLWQLPMIILLLVTTTNGDAREWKDKSGKFSIEAELVKVDGDKVHLQKEDGKAVVVPLSKLSDADRKFLTDQAQSATATTGEGEKSEKKPAKGKTASGAKKPDKYLSRLQGEAVLQSIVAGPMSTNYFDKGKAAKIEGDAIEVTPLTGDAPSFKGTIKVSSAKKPAQIDLVLTSEDGAEETYLGIIEERDGSLVFQVGEANGKRPYAFGRCSDKAKEKFEGDMANDVMLRVAPRKK